MPEEPQPIEQLLHAYRQKRRDAADGPMAMHPATRNMLHAEVARTLGAATSPRAAGASVSWLAAFWPRLALGGVLCAMAAFVVMQVQTGNQPRKAETTADFARRGEAPALSGGEPAPRKSSESLSSIRPDGRPADELSNRPTSDRDAERAAGKTSAADVRRMTVADPLPKGSVASGPAGAPAEATAGSGAPAGVVRLNRAVSSPEAAPESKAAAPNKANLGAIRDLSRNEEDKDLKSYGRPAQKQSALAKAPVAQQPQISTLEAAVPPPRPTSAPAPEPELLALRPAKPGSAAAPTPALTPPQAPLPSQSASADKKAEALYFTTTGLVSAGGAGGAGNGITRYQQVNPRPYLRQNLNSPAPPPVLTTFQIQLTGDALLITDADGSKYEGRLVPIAKALDGTVLALTDFELEARKSGATASPRKDDVLKREKLGEELSKQKLAESEAKARVAVDAYALGDYGFMVSGTNQRLNQVISFRGNFVPADAASRELSELAARVQPSLAEQQEVKRLADLPVAASNNLNDARARGGDSMRSKASLDATPTSAGRGVRSSPEIESLDASRLVKLKSQATEFGIATNPPASVTSVQLPSGLTIRGRVVTGGSNEFEIRAIPTAKP